MPAAPKPHPKQYRGSTPAKPAPVTKDPKVRST